MVTTDPKAVADKFFKAWTAGDSETARGLLHDRLSFDGPRDTLDNVDAYVGASSGPNGPVSASASVPIRVERDRPR